MRIMTNERTSEMYSNSDMIHVDLKLMEKTRNQLICRKMGKNKDDCKIGSGITLPNLGQEFKNYQTIEYESRIFTNTLHQ